MSQLKARIAHVECHSRLEDSETTFQFGGDVLIQDFEMQETEDGEVLEVPLGEVRREFVMDPDYRPKPGERVLGFEPFMITQTEFKSVLATITNTSRSI